MKMPNGLSLGKYRSARIVRKLLKRVEYYSKEGDFYKCGTCAVTDQELMQRHEGFSITTIIRGK